MSSNLTLTRPRRMARVLCGSLMVAFGLALPPLPAAAQIMPPDVATHDRPLDAPDAQASKRMVWKKRPLRLHLSTGQERLVDFPEPVMVGAPPGIETVLRTQIIDDTVYWQAMAPFEVARIQVRAIDSGRVYLFDISAHDEGPAYPDVTIVDAANPEESAAGGPGQPSSSAAGGWNYVTLTRFAAQQLYAPTRLTRQPGSLFRAPVNPVPIPLMRGGRIEATPLAAWRGGSYYVTAVRLNNLTGGTVNLDPRDLRGGWLTATFQHAFLRSKGTVADNTAVYLVSSQPFDETLAGGR